MRAPIAERTLRPGLRTFAVKGGDIAFLQAGSTSAPTIVMLHGWTLDGRAWSPQVSALSNRFHLIVPDRRGFGASAAPPGLGREPDDVLALMDALRVERAAFFAMSQAARIALTVAARAPERVSALALVGAAPMEAAHSAGEIPVAEYRALAASGRLAEMKRRWRAHPIMRTASTAAAALIAVMLEEYAGRDLLDDVQGPPLTPVAPEAVSAPVLLAVGADDAPSRRAASEAWAQRLPNARLALIPRAGHLANLCAPQAFNALAADFVLASP